MLACAPRAVVLAAAACITALSLAACGGTSGPSDGFAQPAATAFRAGDCRTAAPSVLVIGQQARQLGTKAKPAASTLAALTEAQAPLLAHPSTDPQVGAALQKLVAAVGFVRLRSVGSVYDPALGKQVAAAYDGVLQACTSGPAR